MIRVMTVDDIRQLIYKVTLKKFFEQLFDQLERDFSRWHEFNKVPRISTHFPSGVIELMPISDHEYYAFKWVNGYPNNRLINKRTVVAMGALADVKSGYPVLLSEMTILTALRTAATSALASKHLACLGPERPPIFGIIGTGCQSEFQALAHYFLLGVREIYYFDIDPLAMEKFKKNLSAFDCILHACASAQAVVEHSTILTTATAAAGHMEVIRYDDVKDNVKRGLHINAIGGDAAEKTELDVRFLRNTKIVVEYRSQTEQEGEIQQWAASRADTDLVYAELWELVSGKKPGRVTAEEMTLFDSVGFALEDYSVLRYVYQLAENFHVGHMLDMLPDSQDIKDLYAHIQCR